MKCPDCGHEMTPGHLYCETCGREIRIVPDFDPEVENSIEKTLSTVANEITDSETREPYASVETDVHTNEERTLLDDEAMRGKQRSRFVRIAVAVLTVLILIPFAISGYSAAYQTDKVEKLMEEGRYAEANKTLNKLLDSHKGDATLLCLQADCLIALSEKEEALALLSNQMAIGTDSSDDLERLYEKAIQIYESDGDYASINRLLTNCTDESIRTLFQHYMALPPNYSYEGGSYDEVIHLRLQANTTGHIYYTLDGSTPTANSNVYTSPITLESGHYQVNAVFINEYGIESEVIRNSYQINLTIPEAPVVLPESGSIAAPSQIEIDIPVRCSIYYTTDRSDPDENSLQYTGPISIPLGKSNYKFIVISEEGVKSEITSRSYDFAIDGSISVTTAQKAVVHALIAQQILTDSAGHAFGETGVHSFPYETVVQIEDTYYYVFSEYVTDTAGNAHKEERLYAVNVYTGTPNRLIYDEAGQMGLISLV